MNDITIQILNTIGKCGNYKDTKNGEPTEVDIVISPTKIHNNNDTIKVSTGCNMFEGCLNPKCYFSVASRKKNAQ